MRAAFAATLAGVLSVSQSAWAQQQSAQPADPAAQIRALKRQVGALQATVNNLRSELAAEAAARQGVQAQLSGIVRRLSSLQDSVRAMQASSVLDLNGYLSFDNSSGYPTAVFRGINVQVVNGLGNTQTVNGLGNLIVGYNRPRVTGASCSLGYYTAQNDCVNSGGIWAPSHKTGSHNLVGGDLNNYSSWGGLVLGSENSISAPFAVVTGGAGNHARGDFSAVSGGSTNSTGAMYSTVTGGSNNTALGPFSSVNGGSQRATAGAHNWAAGGAFQDH
jgi:hypothetical protein